MKYLDYFLIIISIAFFCGAYYEYGISSELIKNGIEAEATFVDYKVSVDRSKGKEKKSYYPIYEYLDDSNNVLKYVSDEGSSSMNVDIGSKVNLLYSKEINQARINSFWGLFSLSIIEIFLGLVAISVMLYLIIKKRKVETG
jgi:hypothetical protein